jgi:hypothetical protein
MRVPGTCQLESRCHIAQDFPPPAVEAAWKNKTCPCMEAVMAGQARSDSFDNVFARLDQRFPQFN